MRSVRSLLPLALLGCAVAATGGCGGCERRVELDPDPIEQQYCEMIVAIHLDTSGSFADKMQVKGYPFFLKVIDSYFRNRLGSNDQLILAQISGTTDPIFWAGSPSSLKTDFPTQKAFNDYLAKRPDPGGSRVYESLAIGLEYLVHYPGVKEGKTKVCLLALTDMDENYADKNETKTRLLKALAEFGKVKGCLGLYWVDGDKVNEWRVAVQQSGVKNFVIEPGFQADPKLPRFE